MIRYEKANEAPTNTLEKDIPGGSRRMFIKFRQPLGIMQLDKRRGVPAAGEYVIRFSARAIRRKSRYAEVGDLVIIQMNPCAFGFIDSRS